QRQHHPGACPRQVSAAGGRGEGERRPGVRDAARGAAAGVESAWRRRGTGRAAATRDRRGDQPVRGAAARGTAMISVVVCDDVPELRRLLREALTEDADMEVVGEAADGREAIEVIER